MKLIKCSKPRVSKLVSYIIIANYVTLQVNVSSDYTLHKDKLYERHCSESAVTVFGTTNGNTAQPNSLLIAQRLLGKCLIVKLKIQRCGNVIVV